MKYLNDRDLEARIHSSEGFLLVAFLSHESVACRHFIPEYEKIYNTLHLNDSFNPPGGLAVVALNIDENPSETESLGVFATPTNLLYHQGAQVAKGEGQYSALALSDRIIEAVKKRV